MRLPERISLVSLLVAAVAVVVVTALFVRWLRGAASSAHDGAPAAQQPAPGGPRPALAPGGLAFGEAAGGVSDAAFSYVVSPGDTLSTIAARFGTTVEALMAMNELRDPDAIAIGQELRLRVVPTGQGPAFRAVPDSELVFGPAYLDFDLRAFLAGQPGRLRGHREVVNGTEMTGPEIVEQVATDFSVGPRALLALVEARSGWVTGPGVTEYAAGLEDPARAGLWLQLSWLADRLNGGYYNRRTRDNGILAFTEGTQLAAHPSLGFGSFAVQRVLALQSTPAELPARQEAFDAAYRRLFGDPWARARRPVDLARLRFPALQMPWPKGQRWWLTGGPHGGWGDGSAWAALDFVPDEEERGCFTSRHWATAVADGLVVPAGEGQVVLDLDGDGRRETGPVVLYLHLAAEGRIRPGAQVKAGERLGRPSCEGGFSNATHLHIARLYDGEWLAAAGAAPFVLAGWQATGAPGVYDGGLVGRDGARREACECRLEGTNDVRW
jgi:LysM repeat protein